MATVSFEKFAAAVMCALEPEKYNFEDYYNGFQAADADINSESDLLTNNNALQLIDDESAATDSFGEKQKLETVGVIANQLTVKIAEASDEQLVQAAKAVEEINAETEKTESGVIFSKTIESVKLSEMPADQITLLMQETVTALAAQTAAQSKQTEIVSLKAKDQQLPQNATIIDKLNSSQTVAKTSTDEKNIGITLKSKQTESEVKLKAANQNFNDVRRLNEVKDFWDLYPPIDKSEIKYPDAIWSLYEIMSNGQMLDNLNPIKFDLSERRLFLTKVTQVASVQDNFESDIYQMIQDSRENHAANTFNKQTDNRKDSDTDLRSELEERQHLGRQRFQEQIFAEK